MDRNRRLDGRFKTFFPLWLSAKREFNTLMYFDRSLNVQVSSLWLLFFVFFFSDMHIIRKKYVSSWLRAIQAMHRVSASCTLLCVALKGPVHGILCRKTESVWPGLLTFYFFLLFCYLFGLEIGFGEFVTHVNALQTCAHFAETI